MMHLSRCNLKASVTIIIKHWDFLFGRHFVTVVIKLVKWRSVSILSYPCYSLIYFESKQNSENVIRTLLNYGKEIRHSIAYLCEVITQEWIFLLDPLVYFTQHRLRKYDSRGRNSRPVLSKHIFEKFKDSKFVTF